MAGRLRPGGIRATMPQNIRQPALRRKSMENVQPGSAKAIPFDTAKLDHLLEDADLDALVVTSKHNVQYLLGGYRFFFFDYMDAIGVSRYLPVLFYQKGKPENSAYIGYRLEMHEKELGKFWPPVSKAASSGSTDAMQFAVDHIKHLNGNIRRIGIEAAFLPADAEKVLRQGLGNTEIVDGYFPLERLRAVKTPHELALLREASERVVAAMQATFARCRPGMTKIDMVDTLRKQEVERDLTFEYCLHTAGASLNRAPSEQTLQTGDIMSLDSGGNYRGYIGDLCRMAILGAEPDAELVDLLAYVEEIQQAARKPIKAGAHGGAIYAAAEGLINKSPHLPYMEFLAHGMGLISHEAPRLATRMNYSGYDADRPLEAGMVVSIETTMKHPKRGFVKLEDTVAVTKDGWEGFGDTARGWTRAGA
jgi:Xaa-Pro aminopeptidase